jgi:hypothetical protein
MQEFEEEHTEVLRRVVWAGQRQSMWWLVGAGLAFTTAIAATVFAAQAARSTQLAAALALEREATDLGRAVDATVRAARDRATSLAKAPMLRAAVMTDAATVADLLTSEFKVELAPGEVAELFQIEDGRLVSLIRMPPTAPALPAVRDRAVLARDAGGLRVVVGARVDRLKDGVGYENKAGVVAVSVPVDLAAIRAALAERAVDATLGERDAQVRLVHRPLAAGDLVRLVVPSEILELTLTVAPLATAPHMAWLAPVRNACLGLGALLAIAFAAIRVAQRPRSRRR